MYIAIPYGKTVQKAYIPQNMDIQVCEPISHKQELSLQDESEIISNAMAHPIESMLLCELAKNKKTAVIICSDHTRPVPSKIIIPQMLCQLRHNNAEIQITLLIATGFHRATSHLELVEKFGEDIVAHEHIVIHDCNDDSSMIQLGILPSGAPLILNRIAVKADLLVSEGFIEPHFFAGFSGGRKSVLPGICGKLTVLGNHCADFIASPFAHTGILQNNPIHKDMLAAAQMANLCYIMNVILDSQKRVIAAVAGHPESAHEKGCTILRDLCEITPRRLADIVITSNGGAPLDQNLYQGVKGLTAANAAAKKDAVLILCAACEDGTGGDDFYKALCNCVSPAQLLQDILEIPMQKTQPDQWEVQILAGIMAHHKVILVCDISMRKIAQQMKLHTADNLQQAIDMAVKQKGIKARITVIPDGVSVIVNNVY